MKKSITLIVALAMIFGMSQCKKKVETVTSDGLDGGVFVTLNIIGEGKHDVNTATGRVKYSNGDVIYVGNDGKYCGTLTRTSGQFSGTIYPTNVDDYLHFYFVGGSTPSVTPQVGATTSFTVNISNQSSKLPVLSYSKSTRLYTEGVTEYESFLLNKCGLVEFVLTEGTNGAVTVDNLQTEATISFANPNNAIAATGTTGTITLNSQSETSKWAILLPTSAAETTSTTIDGKHFDVTIPVIKNNDFLHTSTAVEIENIYVFSVSSTRTVQFSPGNLEYNANEGWRFAPNNYPSINGYSTNGWVDKFCWGAWSGTPEQWNPLGNNTFTWYGDEYFHGTLGGHDDWFTLSKDQWGYLFNHSHYGYARIINQYNDYFYGIVILPDNSSLTIDETHDGNCLNNEYTLGTWTENMEAYGAVFLPAAGYIQYNAQYDFNGTGRYWTTDVSGSRADYLYWNSGGSRKFVAGGSGLKLSVRLVR